MNAYMSSENNPRAGVAPTCGPGSGVDVEAWTSSEAGGEGVFVDGRESGSDVGVLVAGEIKIQPITSDKLAKNENAFIYPIRCFIMPLCLHTQFLIPSLSVTRFHVSEGAAGGRFL